MPILVDDAAAAVLDVLLTAAALPPKEKLPSFFTVLKLNPEAAGATVACGLFVSLLLLAGAVDLLPKILAPVDDGVDDVTPGSAVDFAAPNANPPGAGDGLLAPNNKLPVADFDAV